MAGYEHCYHFTGCSMAKTAQEAFADMFKGIGKAFIDMATQMIAKALVLKALGVLFPGSSPSSPIPLDIGGAEVLVAQA